MRQHNEDPMRRVTVLTIVFVFPLLSIITLVHPISEETISASFTPPDARSQNAALHLHNSCCISPPVSSPPSVAYVTLVSDLVYWQREPATRVNETRLLGLLVQPVFIFTIVELPENTLQNQPFSVTVILTNLGPQTCAFDIIADPNFWGFTQVIVQSNETRSITFLVQYLPETIQDAGIRLFSLSLLMNNQQILSVESPLYVGYSTVNLILSLLPPSFLFGLCILGICWMRNGKRSRQQKQSDFCSTPVIIPHGEPAMQIRWDTTVGESGLQRLPLNPQVMQQLSQVIQKLGLTSQGSNRYSNDRVVLAWEKKGRELHIVLQGKNTQLIQKLFTLLSESTLSHNQDGDLSDS